MFAYFYAEIHGSFTSFIGTNKQKVEIKNTVTQGSLSSYEEAAIKLYDFSGNPDISLICSRTLVGADGAIVSTSDKSFIQITGLGSLSVSTAKMMKLYSDAIRFHSDRAGLSETLTIGTDPNGYVYIAASPQLWVKNLGSTTKGRVYLDTNGFLKVNV